MKNRLNGRIQLLIVIVLTIVIVGFFIYDVYRTDISLKEVIVQDQQPVGEESLKQEKLQGGDQNPDVKVYSGVQPGYYEDWGNREIIMAAIDASPHHQPVPINKPPPENNPPADSGQANPPTSTGGQTAGSSVRGKAGISPQQAAKAKAYLELKNTKQENSPLAVEEKEYFEEKYKVSSYPELPICVVIPSYKNVANDRYRHNMNSILQQDYSNYHIVFIDDASEDETGRHVEMYIRENNISPDKITVVINQERMMAMPNIYKAAHDYCKPHEIFIIVDGDDELVGRQVFKHFNAIFSSHDVWVMYTNFISIRGSIGYSRPYTKSVLERNSFRKSAFVISHLRAFYTKLFTLIKEEDLRDEEGNWFRAANDVAMYLPILEMSKMRVQYIPEISYMYNSNTGLNNHRVKLKEQKGNERKIKTKPPYEALDTLFTADQMEEMKKETGKVIPIYQERREQQPFNQVQEERENSNQDRQQNEESRENSQNDENSQEKSSQKGKGAGQQIIRSE